MLISQGIWARSDNPTEVKQNKISQHREYNCLNLKKYDERTNIQTDLCIELRYAQLIMNSRYIVYLRHGGSMLLDPVESLHVPDCLFRHVPVRLGEIIPAQSTYPHNVNKNKQPPKQKTRKQDRESQLAS